MGNHVRFVTDIANPEIARGTERVQGSEPPLVDSFGRAHSYLRVSVTDRCNLACRYCVAPESRVDQARRPEMLSYEEVARLTALFARAGVRRIRFTGGEPLVRRGFVQMVELVRRETGLRDLFVTTNGVRLAGLAERLVRAGIRGVNVSLDTLDPARFRDFTGGGDLSRTVGGIHAAVAAGMEVKLNAVLLRGANDDELGRLVDFAWELGATPRFIERMPIGQNAPGVRTLTADEAVGRLGARLERGGWMSQDRHGPARYMPAADGSGRRVGFISAMSEQFCASCNRLRLTATGEIRSCLASPERVPLRELLRSCASDADILAAVRTALLNKRAAHEMGDLVPVPGPAMRSIGG